jgi:phage recombination protein Bet
MTTSTAERGSKADSAQADPLASPTPVLTEENWEMCKKQICPDATDSDFQYFVMMCNRTMLDPFARQICMVIRTVENTNRKVPSIEVTVDGFRLIASRTNKYAGQTPHQWCGQDGVWKDVWVSDEPPMAARVGVYHKDFREPLYAVAKYSSYVQTRFDGSELVLSPSWSRMPELMLAKCAECLALRRAFPQDLSGIYSVEETQGKGMVLDGHIGDEAPLNTQGHAVDEEPAVTEAERAHCGVSDDVRTFVTKVIQRAEQTNAFDTALDYATSRFQGSPPDNLKFFRQELVRAKVRAVMATGDIEDAVVWSQKTLNPEEQKLFGDLMVESRNPQ